MSACQHGAELDVCLALVKCAARPGVTLGQVYDQVGAGWGGGLVGLGGIGVEVMLSNPPPLGAPHPPTRPATRRKPPYHHRSLLFPYCQVARNAGGYICDGCGGYHFDNGASEFEVAQEAAGEYHLVTHHNQVRSSTTEGAIDTASVPRSTILGLSHRHLTAAAFILLPAHAAGL